jgi:hypothetical protein
MSFVTVNSLPLGRVLGSGAQGTVHEHQDDPNLCIKLLKQPMSGRRREAIEHLTRLARWARPTDHQMLRDLTSWPQDVYLDVQGSVVAVVLPRATEAFSLTVDVVVPQRKLTDLSYLIRPAFWKGAAVRSSRPEVTFQQRLTIAIAIVDVVGAMHDYGLVYGDFSERNLLWSQDSDRPIYLLDCDSIRPDDLLRSDNHRVYTEGWQPPHGLEGQQADSAVVAIAILRILADDPNATPWMPDARARHWSEPVKELVAFLTTGEISDGIDLRRLGEKLRSHRDASHSERATRSAVSSRYAKTLLREVADELAHEHLELIESATHQVVVEREIMRRVEEGDQLGARRELRKVDQRFDLDVPPDVRERIESRTPRETFEELILDGDFLAVAKDAVTDDQHHSHSWSVRAVQHALIEVADPVVSISENDRRLALSWEWPDSSFVDCAVVITYGSAPSRTLVVRHGRTAFAELERPDEGSTVAVHLATSMNGASGIVESPVPMNSIHQEAMR